jgi:hypothetical protein
MGKSYGGKQPTMRNTVISKNNGYLGPLQYKQNYYFVHKIQGHFGCLQKSESKKGKMSQKKEYEK